jgi:NADPH2:quinone reductase
MSNNTQKALFVTEVGKPVTLGTRAIPTPGLGEVLIKVAATQRLSSLPHHFASLSLHRFTPL